MPLFHRQTLDLFKDPMVSPLAQHGAVMLEGFALADASGLIQAVQKVIESAPLRHMQVPSGHSMSVAMTNCGSYGWISDKRGYRYESRDPLTNHPWPPMPEMLRTLATAAAEKAGYAGFDPDSCLVNSYAPGTKMSLHQDKDERDFNAPIVSVSLGLKAKFLFGGPKRNDPTHKIALHHGDIFVWGGPSRLFYHGIAPLESGVHAEVGPQRINLTLRKAR
jgi:alkylated DNA repair protein (DNA oxidative demethylase)